MGLPYEKDNNRKFQCFVCGQSHTEYEDYKNHIIEKHEQGRDYVLCPFERCSSPVRDVKLHVKVKHPHEKCPTTGPMRAIIWKDVTKDGKAKTRKPRFRQGFMVSTKNHGKEIQYMSGTECEIFECLEAIPEVITYDAQPFKSGGIAYVFEGKQHHYFPDVSIQFNDGHIEIWEIKPASQTDLPVNRAKWEAANKYCMARGWDFIVITEVGLGKLKQRVRQLKALNESS